MSRSISTTEFAWELRCRDFLKTGEPFDLRDVHTADQIRFCELFCEHCGCSYVLNRSVARFTPRQKAPEPRIGQFEGPPLDLIKLRLRVYEQEGNWEQLRKVSLESLNPQFPDSDLLAFTAWAEHKLGRTRDAVVLLELYGPDHAAHPEVAYRLACLNAALGKMPLAEECLKRAIANSKDPQKLKQRALLEPDLESLRLTTITS